MTVVVHHNPACGTSRKTIELVRASGEEPVIIEYLKEGWTRPQLLALFAAAGLSPRDALRTAKSPADELGLTNPDVDDETIIADHARTSGTGQPSDRRKSERRSPVSSVRTGSRPARYAARQC